MHNLATLYYMFDKIILASKLVDQVLPPAQETQQYVSSIVLCPFDGVKFTPSDFYTVGPPKQFPEGLR